MSDPVAEPAERERGATETQPDAGGAEQPSVIGLVATIARRELWTVARTRSYLALSVVLTAVLVGIAVLGGGTSAGYVPTAVDLLTPLELLVPLVAIAFGYRAVLGDAQRGELDVLRTYPVGSAQQVVGTYLGRAAGLAVAVAVPLAVVAVLVAVTPDPTVRVFATHDAADSAVLFGRFLVLTVLFALTVLAVAIAISAVASSTRSALALAIVALLALLAGLDLLIVDGLAAGWIDEDSLVRTLALSPNSAYRGLVLETTVRVASGAGPRAASPIASLFGLLLWIGAALGAATVALQRR